LDLPIREMGALDRYQSEEPQIVQIA
jgi:hypothetical protein